MRRPARRSEPQRVRTREVRVRHREPRPRLGGGQPPSVLAAQCRRVLRLHPPQQPATHRDDDEENISKKISRRNISSSRMGSHPSPRAPSVQTRHGQSRRRPNRGTASTAPYGQNGSFVRGGGASIAQIVRPSRLSAHTHPKPATTRELPPHLSALTPLRRPYVRTPSRRQPAQPTSRNRGNSPERVGFRKPPRQLHNTTHRITANTHSATTVWAHHTHIHLNEQTASIPSPHVHSRLRVFKTLRPVPAHTNAPPQSSSPPYRH